MGLTIPLVGIYSKELKTNVQTKACKQMFAAALFTTCKSCKQPKCSSTDEWTKMRCIIQWDIQL